MNNSTNISLTTIKILDVNLSKSKINPSGIVKKEFVKVMLLVVMTIILGSLTDIRAQETMPRLKVGAYYFDGWAGQNSKANDPNEPWAKNAPTHLTRRLVEEFPEREPVWGWRDDDLSIMERQIDIAADNGVDFFLFCWYWSDNNGSINPSTIENFMLHTSMNLYLKAKNKNKIKFGLLVANSIGFEINGPENWGKATEFWVKYFSDPQYLTVDGKPLVVIFNSNGISEDDLSHMQDVSKELGLKGLAVAGCGNTEDKSFTYRTDYNIIPGYVGGSQKHKYSELAEAHEKQWIGTEKRPYIPIVTVGWDKRPWEGITGQGTAAGWYYPDRTPEQFKNFLTDAVIWMDGHPTQTTKERLVLIYAWNELGEGGYLVPTKGDPNASYLKVIRSVVSDK